MRFFGKDFTRRHPPSLCRRAYALRVHMVLGIL
jgi:hypothetical protein